MPTRQGSIRLFRFAGIEVFLHPAWFFAVIYFVRVSRGAYTSMSWNILECLALFAIVLMHEFGHALACRSVGGRADTIILWPFGGVAYVDPPSRPGATLWSIAAGPLVNVVLAPVFVAVWWVVGHSGLVYSATDLYRFVRAVMMINFGLLAFNLLPIYPLDGGQILWSLLWFPLGRARSLVVATILGFAGVAALVVVAIMTWSGWLALVCVFIFLNCQAGFRYGLALLRRARAPRRYGYTCPSCGAPPPVGAHWRCGHCRNGFDPFETAAICPSCGVHYGTTRCLECGQTASLADWQGSQAPPVVR